MYFKYVILKCVNYVLIELERKEKNYMGKIRVKWGVEILDFVLLVRISWVLVGEVCFVVCCWICYVFNGKGLFKFRVNK